MTAVVIVQNMDVQYEQRIICAKVNYWEWQRLPGSYMHAAISSSHSPMIMACSTHIYTSNADPC